MTPEPERVPDRHVFVCSGPACGMRAETFLQLRIHQIQTGHAYWSFGWNPA